MHLDAAAVGIVEGMVAETRKIEVAVEFAVDAREEVEIEPGRDAGFVVVGGVEDAAVLYQVDPDDQGWPRPSIRPAWRRNEQASCGSKFPMVDPGKKPTWAMAATAAGNENGRVKSASTGSTASCG